ncbi:hypothetical protein BJ741DRAFT_588878 [Chytriomyces cf. hyalinus JEL632]|nr:hypothetical protein BJ741DRAFT_588878 [Chytriomyces cf. hyalinus JEL632]
MSALNALLDAVTAMHDHPEQSIHVPPPSSHVLPPLHKLSPIFPSASQHQHVQLPSISEMFKGYASPPGTPSLQSPFVLQSSRRTSIVSLSYQQSQVHRQQSQSQSTSPVMGYSAAAASLAPAHAAYLFPTPNTAFAKQPSSHTSDISRPLSPLNRMNMTDTDISHQHHYQQQQIQHPHSHMHQFQQQQISPSAPIAETDCETNSNSNEPQQQLHQQLQQQLQQQRQAKYVCTMPNCVKTFKRKHHLESHLISHSPHKPHKCLEPGCGAAYRRAQELRRHMRIVTH